MALTFGADAEFDREYWEEIDRVANLYNRLVLFDAHMAHGASAYFGDRLENARLFQNFFFDTVAADQTQRTASGRSNPQASSQKTTA